MKKYRLLKWVFAIAVSYVLQNSNLFAQNNLYTYVGESHSLLSAKHNVNADIVIKDESRTLQSVLMQLNKTRGIYFLLTDQTIGSRLVNAVDLSKGETEKILDNLLVNTNLGFKKVNNQTFIIEQIKDKEKERTSDVVKVNSSLTEVNNLEDKKETNDFAIIKGKVVSSDGSPLSGASVLVKGTTRGTTTNSNGEFSINAEPTDVLVVSFIGYDSREITVGTHTSLSITLSAAKQELSEVTISTALGIQRKLKTLTYATQQVNNSDLTTVKDASFVNSLTGKVAGVNITKSSSGIGGSTRVIIRGNKSTRENQPLYVVDGVPLVNFSPAQPGDEWGQSGVGFVGLDGGDGIANLNPDDIESVTILKGASAAALYGSSASNGVILITTKKGRIGKTRIDVSSELTFDNPLYKQPLQFKYGQTTPPSPGNAGSVDSWGGIVNAPDHVTPFFQTGVTSFNSISLSGGTDRSQTYFSYSYTDNKGIEPTDAIKKHNINIRQTSKFFNDRLTSDVNVLFINQNSHNRPVSGLYDNPLTGLYEFPRGLDFNKYKQYEVYSSVRNTKIQNWWDNNYDSSFAGSETEQNPYWLLNRNTSDNSLNRLYTNVTLKYKINDWLNIQARGNVDKSYNDINLESYATTSTVLTGKNGSYNLLKAVNTQLYADLLLTATRKLNKHLGLTATVGTSINDGKAEQTNFGTAAGTDGLHIPNIFVLANIIPDNLSINETISHRQVQSLMATTQLGLNDYLFLDLSGRNDWSSTLAYTPVMNKGYFYYSGGVTAILNQMIHLPTAITYSKFRVSYAKVGNDVSPYVTNPPPFYVTFSPTQSTSANGKGPVPGTYLQPEDNRSFETGTEWRFLKDRLGFDFTYYENNNFKQYLEVPAPNGSGLNTYYLNGGNIRNNGVELTISATPVSTKNISWITNFNYAKNHNKVISLTNDQLHVTAPFYTLTGLGNLLYASYLVAGGSWGDIYGRYFQRSASGAIVVDNTGAPVKGSDPNNTVGGNDQKLLGNPNPKYSFGWNNTINVKNISISFLIDGKIGGKVMSVTNAVLDGFGDSKATGDARDAGGVKINAEYANGQNSRAVKCADILSGCWRQRRNFRILYV